MQEERYHTRDGSYSAWHRARSTKRFVGLEKAQNLSMIDLDAVLWIEYEEGSRIPIALVETARDVGQTRKPATVITELAKLSRIPAFVVLYKLAETKNPADLNYADIERFRVRRVWPEPETLFVEMTPKQWAEKLMQIREVCAAKLDRLVQNSPGLF